MGKTRKKKAREKLAGREKKKEGRESLYKSFILQPSSAHFGTFEIIRFLLSNCQWVGIFLKFLARLFRAALIPYASQSNLKCKKWVGRQHTTFTLCQNAACSSEYFLLQVDYALEGSTFWLSKLCDFCRLFHAERSRHAYWFSGVIVFGWHDWWFALWYKSIFVDLFWNVKFFIAVK